MWELIEQEKKEPMGTISTVLVSSKGYQLAASADRRLFYCALFWARFQIRWAGH